MSAAHGRFDEPGQVEFEAPEAEERKASPDRSSQLALQLPL